jgi:FixJ family two-component response regulator
MNTEIEAAMSLTKRERQILELRAKDMTDYGIAREIGALISSVQRSRANGLRKLSAAKTDLAWAQNLNLKF